MSSVESSGVEKNPVGEVASPSPAGLRCLRCGHEWTQRGKKLPVKCSKCQNPGWDRAARPRKAGVAQLVERLPRKQVVPGSIPGPSSTSQMIVEEEAREQDVYTPPSDRRLIEAKERAMSLLGRLI
jgi:hypothetical protein